MTCMECGAAVRDREFHDYIECVRHRWSAVGCEPGQLAAHKLKQDMLAVLHELARMRFPMAATTPGEQA